MKQVNVFLYCENELNPQIVLYLVMVGKSEREQKAHAWLVRHCAGDNRFFYHRNSAKIAEFLSKVRQSWTDAQTLHLHGVFKLRKSNRQSENHSMRLNLFNPSNVINLNLTEL